MRPTLLAYLLFLLIACGQAKDKLHTKAVIVKSDTSSKQKAKKEKYESLPVYDKAHPNAKKWMSDKFYFNSIDENAPFGSNDGADAYTGFKNWRLSHKKEQPGDYLITQINDWGYPQFDFKESNFEQLKPYLSERELGCRFMSGIDAAIIAIAFGQLYLEGSIDKEFKETAKKALTRQLLPELLVYWGEPLKTERELKFKKMLATLNHLN